MRFAGNTSNVGSWIQAGKAGAKGAADAFKVARSNAPDYGGIGETNQKSRSLERQAATAAEAQVANAGLKALETTRKTEINVDAKMKVLDKKLDAKRKAGIVGAVGAVAGGAFLGMENKKAEARQKERDAATDAREQQKLEIMRSFYNRPTPSAEDGPEMLDVPEWNPPSGGSDTDTDTDTGGETNTSTGGDTPSTGSSPIKPSGEGGIYTQEDMKKLAEQVGFSPENAKIMSAIGMGESRGNAGIDTVQSGLDPGKNNEYSIGLVQINTQAHMDKLTRRGWSEDDLRDPLKNLTIAKEVFDEAGGSFKPWGAFTNGSYTKFLK